MIRTANIEVSLQRLSILRIEHPQANPLTLACTLRPGETLPSGLTVTAEIHTSRNVAAETTPLASSSVTVAADATSFQVSFLSDQTNQTVTPESVRALWLVVYGVDDADQLHVLAGADLLLGWHAISRVTPPPPTPAVIVEKGGVAWATARQYAAGTMVTVGTTAYVASSAHTSGSTTQPGVGASWNTVWVVLSGGSSATNLSTTASPTNVVIVSDTGTDATIVAADGTNAGLMLPAEKTKLAGVAAGATANATDAQLRDRNAHTGTQAISTIVNLQTTLDGKAASSHTHSIAEVTNLATTLSAKADLVGGKLDAAQLPDLAVTQYLGTAANQTAMLLLVGQRGDWCVRSDDGKVYVVTGEPSSTLGNWTSLSYPTAPVLSVAGRTGSITLNSEDVSGLGALATLATVGTSQIDNNAVTTSKINNAAVTNAKLANANAGTIKANLSGASATPQDNDLIDVAAALPVFSITQRGMMPAAGAGTNARVMFPTGAWGDTFAFGTLTASDPLTITQTWNNGTVVFTAFDIVVTQTAANSNSYLLRCRGGASGATDRFYVLIDGTAISASGAGWFNGACGLGTGSGFYLNDASARIQLGSSSNSPNLHRESDGSMSIRNGTAQMATRVHDTYGSATDYHRVSTATVRATLSALSGASVTSAGLIPVGAIVVGVTAKVLTAITGATSWQLGTVADPDRFAATGGIALGSTTDNRNWTSGALECFLTATDIVLTANGSNFTGGSIYISVQYIRGEAD